MFGIGLPEMLLIMALALIVVGPDKLPDLARSLAKGLMELKKTAEGLKEQLSEDGNPLDEIKPDLEAAAKSLKDNLLETPPYLRDTPADTTTPAAGVNPPEDNAAAAYEELMQHTTNSQELPPDKLQNSVETTPHPESDITTSAQVPEDKKEN